MHATAFTLPAMPRKPLPESEKKVNIGVRIAPSLLTALQELAASDDRTVSYVAEKFIREGVERAAGKPKQPRK